MNKATKIIIGITVLILGVWDIIAFLVTDNATISVVITDSSYYTPWVPFMFGFLMGHWFAPARGSKD